ncbi:MAG: oxidoreductase [Parabacteroides johnsonii]|nr:oxidoreductase [Parabacteroides johnsonii]
MEKYGIEISFLWGSISIWTNGYFVKIDNKTRRSDRNCCF